MEVLALGEDRVHEPVRGGVDLPLGERPQLDRLHAARQCVGEGSQTEHSRRSGEEEPSWPGVGVHLLLDGA